MPSYFCEKAALTYGLPPRLAFSLYPSPVFSGLGYFFPKKYPSGVWGSAPHIHSPSCRGAGRGAPHKPSLGYAASLYRYTFFRCTLPFPYTPVRFFRVSGTFSQKSTRAGRGAAPHIYISPHVGERGGASHITLPITDRRRDPCSEGGCPDLPRQDRRRRSRLFPLCPRQRSWLQAQRQAPRRSQ